MHLSLHTAPLPAGAVGVIVGQLCKHVYGCKVVGAAGSDDKVCLNSPESVWYEWLCSANGVMTRCC
jgi:hypothetical protein